MTMTMTAQKAREINSALTEKKRKEIEADAQEQIKKLEERIEESAKCGWSSALYKYSYMSEQTKVVFFETLKAAGFGYSDNSITGTVKVSW